MKLIIHDLSNEDFSSISKNIRGDNIVISKCKGINRCIGCFGCWIKTPGECVIKDDYNKMSEKIALVSCSGLSPLGLVVRAASVELALEEENIVAACITEYSAQPNNCSPILDDAKIVSITGCSDDRASVILNEKDINPLVPLL